MSYETIIFEKEGSVAILKFNRPKALNAINPEVLKEVKAVLDQVEDDESIKVKAKDRNIFSQKGKAQGQSDIPQAYDPQEEFFLRNFVLKLSQFGVHSCLIA
ncbi:MAG: enoyl-CoA hydratase-related protein [Desulfobulbales bacterium]